MAQSLTDDLCRNAHIFGNGSPRMPYKQGVTGSNPVGPTVTETRPPRDWGPFFVGEKTKKGSFKMLSTIQLGTAPLTPVRMGFIYCDS